LRHAAAPPVRAPLSLWLEILQKQLHLLASLTRSGGTSAAASMSS
jgi:hypothetical protein